MAQVTVTIDGKTYRMACDEGQEEHLSGLAERFDGYIAGLRGSFGEIGDQRLTVMAGIMVMDELTELQKRVTGLESEMATLRRTRDEALVKADKNDAALTGALARLAERIEGLAQRVAGGRGATAEGEAAHNS
ncbi:MAG: cell division protein ZapA [Rhizobiaceae bacterium]|nr:cell division protein ZapA [Rhizobiaceae bacterium]MCV0407378.1 cell division protein ZapA [Rhizobiaceae bacterium]